MEAASGEGEGLEKGSGGATSTEMASREGRRSREPMERSALLRRQAFFSCGFRQVAHCMHRLGRLPPDELGLPLPACTGCRPQSSQNLPKCLITCIEFSTLQELGTQDSLLQNVPLHWGWMGMLQDWQGSCRRREAYPGGARALLHAGAGHGHGLINILGGANDAAASTL